MRRFSIFKRSKDGFLWREREGTFLSQKERFPRNNIYLTLISSNLETFSSTPTAAMKMLTDVPPALKKGRGRPVVGKSPTTTPILRNACPPIIAVMPAARRQPNRSGQRSATRIPA